MLSSVAWRVVVHGRERVASHVGACQEPTYTSEAWHMLAIDTVWKPAAASVLSMDVVW